MHKVVMAAGERVSLSRSKQGGLMNQLYCGVDIAKETAVFCLLVDNGEPLERATTFPPAPDQREGGQATTRLRASRPGSSGSVSWPSLSSPSRSIWSWRPPAYTTSR